MVDGAGWAGGARAQPAVTSSGLGRASTGPVAAGYAPEFGPGLLTPVYVVIPRAGKDVPVTAAAYRVAAPSPRRTTRRRPWRVDSDAGGRRLICCRERRPYRLPTRSRVTPHPPNRRCSICLSRGRRRAGQYRCQHQRRARPRKLEGSQTLQGGRAAQQTSGNLSRNQPRRPKGRYAVSGAAQIAPYARAEGVRAAVPFDG